MTYLYQILPLFLGVGYAATVMAFWLDVYYIIIIAHAFYYLYSSFTLGSLPWKSCEQDWNTDCCKSYYSNISFTCREVSLFIKNLHTIKRDLFITKTKKANKNASITKQMPFHARYKITDICWHKIEMNVELCTRIDISCTRFCNKHNKLSISCASD